jgi:DNA-binding MarR family transcriptional regulator
LRAGRSAAQARPEEQTEAYSFRRALVYWASRFEGQYNREFIKAMGGDRGAVSLWRVLTVASEIDGATIGELADHTQIERTVLSKLLASYEKRGLVRREVAADDRRAVRVHLTEAGREYYACIQPLRRAVFARAIEGLPSEEIALATDLFRRMAGNLDR